MLGIRIGVPSIIRPNRRNLIKAPSNFASSNWTKAAGSAATTSTIEDNSGTNFGNVNQAFAFTSGGSYEAQLEVLKDAIARTTRFPQLRLSFTGGTGAVASLSIDTSTGERFLSGGVATKTGDVEDAGDYWRLILRATDGGANTTGSLFIYPAAGADASWATSAAATGTITARNARVFRG